MRFQPSQHSHTNPLPGLAQSSGLKFSAPQVGPQAGRVTSSGGTAKWAPTVSDADRASIKLGSEIKQPYTDGSSSTVFKKIDRDTWKITSGPRFVGAVLSVKKGSDGVYPATANEADFLDDAWLKGYKELPAVAAPSVSVNVRPLTAKGDATARQGKNDDAKKKVDEKESAADVTDEEVSDVDDQAAMLPAPVPEDNTKYYILGGVAVIGILVIGFLATRRK